LSAAREEKQKQVAELAEKLERAQAVILVDFRGLTVLQSSELRNRLRPHGVEFKVVKNTMARRAAQQVGLEGVDQVFEGPTAMAFAYHDPVAPARELTRFNRETGMPQIKGGILGGRFVDVDEVNRLATMPSRDELIGKVVGGFAAPLYGLAAVTSGLLRNLVYVVDAVRRAKENAA